MSRRFKVWVALVALLGAILSLSASPGVAGARQPSDAEGIDDITALPLGHFWCYNTTSTPVNETVSLQDQFHTAPINVVVGQPKYLCNPVRKRHNDKVFAIPDPDAHLMMYQIGVAQAVAHKVQVKNQFGKKVLKVFEPSVLLAVPTQKDPHAAPQGLDHFQCYRAKGEVAGATVDLRDQFGAATNRIVGRPVLLCNPARKVHNNVAFEILHPEAHLVCYKVTPKDFQRDVGTKNQFRTETVTVIDPDLLCAPSRKTELPFP